MDLSISSLKSRRCSNDTECQRRYSNPALRCIEGVCEEERCRNNSVCPMDSLCIKGNCIDVAMVRTVSGTKH